MRARVIDPTGPLWTRLVVLLLPPLLLGLGVSTGLFSDRAMALLGAALFVLPALVPRLRPREAEIVPGPGFVDIKRAGLLDQRIRGRSVKGASTAFLTQGIGLVLQHGDRPITLELHEDRDADAVRDALGIGHHGFGRVGWTVHSAPRISMAQMVWVAFAGVCGVAAVMGTSLKAQTLGLAVGALFAGYFYLLSKRERAKRPQPVGIELEPRGVILLEPRGEIPYGAIIDAKVTDYGIVILTVPQFNQEPIHVRTRRHMTPEERAHCVAQIIAAARRARGLGPREPLVSGQVEDLARGAADARGWLLRLDATAQQMASGAGYRGVAVDHTELWAALEDHEADEHVRAAAARVLVRTDKESRKRIQAIAASTRDKITERRIRVVLEPDIDEASRELDELDQRRLMTRESPRAP